MREKDQYDFYGKNQKQKYVLYPYLILRFVMEKFDENTIKALGADYKNLAFILASFILPKFVIKGFSADF